MPISLPSKEVHSVDIPEIDNFLGKFHYNYHTPDESVNENVVVPYDLLNVKNTNNINFLKASQKIPRFVEFVFTPKLVNEKGQSTTNPSLSNSRDISPTIITDNLDNIISEDTFSSNEFTSVNFHDGEFYDKVYETVSGTIENFSIDNDIDSSTSYYKIIKQLSGLVGDSVDDKFLVKYGISEKKQGLTFDTTIAPEAKEISLVKAHIQLNSKIIADVIQDQIFDPLSPFGEDLTELYSSAKSIQDSIVNSTSLAIGDSDYKTVIPTINISRTFTGDSSFIKTVGYIIDKHELTQDGTSIVHQPVIVEGSNISRAFDSNVKYGTIYRYEIRTIALFSTPAIDSDTNEILNIKSIISSKPSNTVYVNCIDEVAPPPPNNLGFTFNFETNKLLLHWSFPVNSQRDIKKFQIFRRKSLDVPFELMKMYDFDDSEFRYDNLEQPSDELIEYITNPATFWIDDEFLNTSKYIYAIASIDAHGLTSNYSAQFEISFDVFKNRLVKSLISHQGAPKPYPNYYVENELFEDSIKTSGPRSKKMKIYFNPEYYDVIDDKNNVKTIIETKQSFSDYVLQITNLDYQLSEQIVVTIDDKRTTDDEIGVVDKR